MRPTVHVRTWLGAAVAVLLVLALAVPAVAQTTTATIKGKVTSDGKPVDGAQVVAVDKTTGFTYQAISEPDGSYALPGLRPGSYDITVTMLSYKPATQTLQVLLGQTVNADMQVSPESVVVENVTVRGDLVTETRTSVISTNVTQEQIQNLPQSDRNFLNFAQLAPGVRVTQSADNKQVRILGQPASAVNVFVDGNSYKNEVIEGGVVGQDSSRGNPFPQNAVQEFQVLSQNFKAEYEKASTGLITAVTKSGGNIWSGNLFYFMQDKGMVEKDYFAKRDNLPKGDYSRDQYGFSIGGPIVKDKLTLFVSYEKNQQDRANRVAFGTNPDPNFDPSDIYANNPQGNVTAPFDSDLYFGKLSWQPRNDQTVELTAYRRAENEIKDFGGGDVIRAYATGTDIDITVDSFGVKHKWVRGKWLNEASVQYLKMDWNPTSLDNTQPFLEYQSFAKVGGNSNNQLWQQERTSIRDDFTYFLGPHTLKFGAYYNMSDYTGIKEFGGNPTFNFRYDTTVGRDFSSPWQAFLSAGDPSLSTSNDQYGLYGQDDWQVTPKLTLNLGLRWDYESDMLNQDFVTPQEFVDVLGTFDGGLWGEFSDEQKAGYISTGSSRESPTGLIQPRVGFSYDFSGSGKSVLFGGFGRYYDRVLYNYAYDEKFRQQWRTSMFCFTENPAEVGTPASDCATNRILWDDSYLSKEGLQGILDSGSVQGAVEIFLIPNDVKVPYNDQASIGYRHRFGNIQGEISYSYVRGKNGFTHIFGNRDRATGNLVGVGPGYTNLLLATFDKKYWYDGINLKMERPITVDGKWGYTFTYTYSEAKQQGNDAFSLDYFTIADYPEFYTPDDERHKIYATAMVRVPWDVLLSANVSLGSGLGYDVLDATAGFGFYDFKVLLREQRPEKQSFLIPGLDWWAFRQVDLRAQKTFKLPGRQSLNVSLEGFNVFGHDNLGCLDGWVLGNPNFGQPNCALGTTRSFQLGAGYSF